MWVVIRQLDCRGTYIHIYIYIYIYMYIYIYILCLCVSVCLCIYIIIFMPAAAKERQYYFVDIFLTKMYFGNVCQ